MSRAPFRVRRRVGWGACDPAGIIYTPRGVEFAVEVLEAWWREVLEVPWPVLLDALQGGSPIVHLELDYRRPLRPEDELTMTLWLEAIGGASARYRVRGEVAGETAFECVLVAVSIDRARFRARRIPDALRARMERYRADCGTGNS
ncbi:acyl-CoA thioesterase [Inmirania thermothiophila]|uniref:acyl-CoA thioesterase n=1 Tax=Inmirania thermothiophila TaxID=1750597 RepID=UPI001474244C|nr:thioesterase family protein [Inmirania thermothiophila]